MLRKEERQRCKNHRHCRLCWQGRIIPLSEIASEVTYIPLETTDSSLVGNINSVLYEGGQIYIVHNTSTVSVFDNNGKFIRKINRQGRGPEEYLKLMSGDMLEIDPDNRNIILLSLDTKLYEYTEDGVFVRKVQIPKIEGCRNYMNWGQKISDNTYIADVSSREPFYEYCAVVFDSLSNVKLMIPSPKINYDEITGIISQSEFRIVDCARFTKFEDKVRIIYSNPEIIRSIDNGLRIDTVYTINYGEYKMTLSNKDGVTSTSRIIIWLGSLLESKNYLYIWLGLNGLAHEPVEQQYTDHTGKQVTFQNTNSLALFNKKTGDLTLMNQPLKGKMGFKDDIEGGPVFWPRTVSSQEYLVAAYTAVEFKDFAENFKCSRKIKDMAAGLNENDNPVIAIVKLK